MPDGSDYRVIAQLVDYPSVFSEGPQFTIKEAVLDVTHPASINGRMEDIVEGTEVEIKWSTKGIAAGDKVSIELESDNKWTLGFTSVTHLSIAKSTANTGTYKWIVPSDGNPPAADGYFFTVTWNADDKVKDSTSKFTLVAHPDSIGVNAPQANLMLAQSATVTWHVPESVTDGDKVNVYLVEAGSFKFCNGNIFASLCGDKSTKIGTASARAETMTYTVPENLNAADDYRYYVTVEGKSSIDGESVEFGIETLLIKVTSPKKGTKVKEGDVLSIALEAYGINDPSTKIKLELWDDIFIWADNKHHAIAETKLAWTAAQGVWKKSTFEWTVPALDGEYDADSNYYIRATVVGTDVVDESDNFEIARRAGSLSVTSPKTDSRLITTEETTITWNSKEIDSNTKLNIYLKRDGAQESFLNFLSGKDIDLLTVATGVLNTGTYTWTVPSTAKLPNLKKGPDYYDGYYIYVEIADFNSVNDASSEFYIQDASIFITNPTKDQKVEEGTTMEIAWKSRGLEDAEKMQLELHKAHWAGFGFVTFFDEKVYETVSSVGSGGTDWEVPSDLEDIGDHYWKGIVNDNVQDDSETFEIVRQPGTISVTKPTVGDNNGILGIFGAVGRKVFVSNSNIEVEWTTKNMPKDATYSVHLRLDGGLFSSGTVKLIAENVANSKFSYTVPAGMAEDDDYYFRVTRTGFPTSYSDSNRFELKKATLKWTSPEPRSNNLFDFSTAVSYEEGDRVKVKWDSAGIPATATMTISLMDYDFGFWNDDTHTVLTPAATNTGEAWVNLPKNGIRLDDSYYFKIQFNDDKRVEALTKNFKFTGKEGSIKITSPKAGDTLIPHEEVVVTWSTEKIPDDAVIDLHLYESRNMFISLFAADGKALDIGTTKNTGKFSWKVPDLTPSDDYYIKASWTEFRSVVSDSDEFEIAQGTVYVKPFAVDNANYIHNQQMTVEWDYEGLSATETADLTLVQYEEPGSFWDIVNVFGLPTGQATMAKGVKLNAKKFVYTIPKNLPASQHYVVQLQVQGKPGVKGNSADACGEKIRTCSEWVKVQNHAGKLKITEPHSLSAPLRFGDTSQILWTASNDIPQSAMLEIQLYESRWWPFDDNQKVVITDVQNTGSFDWKIPSTGLDEGNDYYLSITWKDHPTVTDESAKFGIYNEYIRLSQGTLGGKIQEGETHTIKWSSKGIPADGTVSIELFNDGFLFFDSSVKHIAKNVKANDGEFEWNVPNNLKGGDDFYVRIYWDQKDDIFDESKTFTLVGHAGTINVNEPSADESDILWITVPTAKKFVAGTTMDIAWDSTGVPADKKVSITAYLDASALDLFQVFSQDLKEVVAAETANTGTFSWKIPGGLPEASSYYIVVQYIDFPSVLGESAEFALVKGLITVSNPTKSASSDFLAEGESYDLNWKTIGPGAEEKVTIRLMDDDWFSADDEHALIAKDVANTGSFTWTLPNDLPVPDKAFYITVEWSADAGVIGKTENFEIRAHPGSIKPSIGDCDTTGCLYAPTETSSITWSSSEVSGGTVNIELWQNRFILGPKKVQTVKAGADVDAGMKFDWVVPFKLEGTYFYRVVWNDFPSVSGDTAEFKIGRTGLIRAVKGVPIDGTPPAIYHEQLQISWEAPRISSDTYMTIELFDSDAPFGMSFGTTWFDEHHAVITKKTKNTGEFTWNIPAAGLEVDDTDDFFIVVSVAEDLEVSGKSDQFKIEPPVVSNVALSSDSIDHVSTLGVTWSATRFAPDAKVVIELWDDQGFFSAEEKVLTMATVDASQQRYDWIPAKVGGLLPSSGYKVRIHWSLNANVYADSKDFEIFHDGPVIRVLEPSADTDVIPGTTTAIEWVSHDLVPAHKLNIELWDRLDSTSGDSKDTYISQIGNVANSGQLQWTPSASQLADTKHLDGNTYFIRVRWEGTFEDPGSDETVSDSAQFSFTPFGRPGKPELNSENSDAVTSGSVDLVWGASVTTGSVNLVGYEVQMLPLKISAVGDPWKETVCSTDSPCAGSSAVIDQLEPGIGYQFRVRAVVLDGDRRRQAANKKMSAWSDVSEQFITALPSTSTTTVYVSTSSTQTTTTTKTPLPGTKPTGKIPDLLLTSTSTTLPSSGGENGGESTTTLPGTKPTGGPLTTEAPTSQEEADKLEDDLEKAKEVAEQLCGNCTAAAGDCSVACQKAREFAGEVEKDWAAAASQAANDELNNTAVVDAGAKNGGKIAGALIGVLLLIVLIFVLLFYRQKREGIPHFDGEVQVGNSVGHENPMYDHVGLEGGNAVAVNARTDGSMSNPTYDVSQPEDSVTYDNADATTSFAKRQQSFKVPMADGSELVVTQDEDADTYGELPAIPTVHQQSEA